MNALSARASLLGAALVTGLVAVTATASGGVINEDLKLWARDGGEGDIFGFSIAIDNGVVAVGAEGDDGNGYIDDVHGYDFVNDDGDPLDGGFHNASHGSHVAGIIGAVGNNVIGVVGVNWECEIVVLKACNVFGGCFVPEAIDALQYVIDNDIKLSNNSYGFEDRSQAHEDIIAASQAIGHIFVAIAHNQGQDIDPVCRPNSLQACCTDADCPAGETCDASNSGLARAYPAAYCLPNIISVAATDNGDMLWSIPFETQFGANITTPVWCGDNVLFCSAAYGSGSRGIRLVRKDGKTTPEELWHSRKYRIHFGTAVHVGDYIFGSSGDMGPAFIFAVNAKTGKHAWRDRDYLKANLVYGDGKLIFLDEDGNLMLAEPDADGLNVRSKVKLLKRNAWTVPTLAGDRLYVRDRKGIMALDLSASGCGTDT